MLNRTRANARTLAKDQRGVVLVITALAMTVLLAVSALAIDSAIWFVHGKHLQTQADAAAFAGGDAMAAAYENGSCSDSAITSVIAQYDGSQTAGAGLLPANQQVPLSPSFSNVYSPTAHNLFDQVNQANYKNQSIPADTGLTGSPCNDATVDVKMTESNLPSFLTALFPPYINKQAAVMAQTIGSATSSPFVLPNIQTPKNVAVFVVGENANTPAFSSDAILAGIASCSATGNTPPCLTSSSGGATWSAGSVSVPFTATPAALVVAQSASPITQATVSGVTTGAGLATFCASTGITCYDKTDGTGLTYTRTYSASTPNFPTQAPAVADTSVSDAPGDPAEQCQSSGSTNLFTGFVSSASACSLTFTADMNFGSGTNNTCAALSTLGAKLTITASSGASTTLACPNTGGSASAAGSANGNWTSSTTLSIPANAGPVTFDLSWTRTGGGATVPLASWETGGNGGTCGNGSNACKADFKIVQRVFMGASDQNSATTSNSGTVAGAALTTAAGVLTSTPANQTVNGLGITIDFQALYDTPAVNGHIPAGSYTDIAYGSQQGNGLGDCGQGVNNGNGTNNFDVQENAIAGLFTCTTFPVIPSPTGCGANSCPNTVPGNKFLQWLDGGMATRIYGCPEVNHSTQNNPQNGCATPMSAAACAAHPNYWSTQNAMADVVSNTSDPRLMTVMVTDPGTLANGNNSVPVRHYAEFYVTGWTGDPCAGVNVSGQTSSNQLYYINEDTVPTDAANDFFLVGHFVKTFTAGTGSGTACVLSSIDNCTLTVTK